MNQEVFRELVSASRTEQAGHGQGYDENFGQRNTQQNLQPNKTNKDSRTLSFMPRQVGKDDARETHLRFGYMDRAEMRRRGLEVPVEASISATNQTSRNDTALDPHADAEHADDSDVSISDTELEAALEVGRAQKQSYNVQEPIERKNTFRPAIVADTKPEFIYVNGKRMRKKRKQAPVIPKHQTTDRSFVPKSENVLSHRNIAVKESHPIALQDDDHSAKTISRSSGKSTLGTASQAEDTRPNERDRETNSGDTTANESLQYQTKTAPSFGPRVDEDADDIFADAGQWQGLSDEEVSQTQKPRRDRSGDWFASESNAKETQAENDAPATQTSTSSPSHQSPEESEDESVPTRLQGLESSALPTEMSRWLLDRNDSLPSHTTSAPPRKRKRSKKGRGQPDSP
ncbi:hypothetical protein MPSI1_002545 [Malassezia psittaci]|uniref:Uncharacterized protein n=1 Tax=Malassezia psittaci TaxID=1821823 RepID=A0AAF0FAI6_9BASI|nr:hypothetical protein MPSI1_002545 [Malassezia psittaci]